MKTTKLSLRVYIGLVLSAIPKFKRAAPKEYRLAGSPSPLWSPTSDFILFWYLLRNRHRSLPAQALVRKLSALKQVKILLFVGAGASIGLVIASMFGALQFVQAELASLPQKIGRTSCRERGC